MIKSDKWIKKMAHEKQLIEPSVKIKLKKNQMVIESFLMEFQVTATM